MTEYLTEQEQVELLKNWIKQYSLVILMGVVIAMTGITGWRYWQQRQIKMLSHASSIYDEMLTKRAQSDTSATVVQAEKLFSHYPRTVYAQMAAFMLGRDAALKQDYQAAEKYFDNVINKSSVASFKQIARLRLARVLIADKKPEEAINILEKVNDKSFNGLTDEIRGDAYFAMRNPVKAREAYKRALTELPNAEVIRPLLAMKYDNLATLNPSAS